MTTGKLVAITGPAAVGKSTVARALQNEFVHRGELWLAVELDVFARALPREWIALGSHRGAHAERGYIYARAEDSSIGLTLGTDGRSVLAAFHRSTAAIVRSGVNVVCETIVYDDEDWNDWSQALGDLPACWVRLGAPVTVLEGREQAGRAHVFQGLARGMTARQPVGVYAIEADTGTDTPDAIVQRIIAALPA